MTATTSAPELQAALDGLASLYGYPTEDLRGVARDALTAIGAGCPDAAEHVADLVERLECADLAENEERYVGTFELNPLCALEVGWQLYGEQYARGAFLVRMRQLTRDACLPESTELSDHLPNVLRVIPRVDVATAEKLSTRFAQPALTRMRKQFAEQSGNPYSGLLAATALVLERRFGAEVTRE